MLNNILMIIVIMATLWIGYNLYWSLQEDDCIAKCGEWNSVNKTCRQYECKSRIESL